MQVSSVSQHARKVARAGIFSAKRLTFGWRRTSWGTIYDLRLETVSAGWRLWDFNSHHGSVDSLWISICTCWIWLNLFDTVCTFHVGTMRSIPLNFKWLLPGKNVQALTRRVSSGNLDLLQRAQLCWWWPWQIHLFRAEQHIESGSIEVVLWKMWYCQYHIVMLYIVVFFKACFLEKYEKCSFLTSYSYASFFQWMPPYLVRSESAWIDSHLW